MDSYKGTNGLVDYIKGRVSYIKGRVSGLYKGMG